jgi:hypothetical protein
VQGETQPQLAGHILTWVRDRWTGHASVSDVVLKDLNTGRGRELWHDNGLNPTTNGERVAWEVQTTDQPRFTLIRYDIGSASRGVLDTSLDSFSPGLSGPHVSKGLLTWRTRTLARVGATYTIVARDLRTGRDYRLAHGTDAYYGSDIAYTIITGPGWGSGNRAVRQQTVFDRHGRGQGYLWPQTCHRARRAPCNEQPHHPCRLGLQAVVRAR